MIDVAGLTKRYGDRVVVDHLSFTVEPGKVTGFLGPNGAGKSTTMRMILGLDASTSGTALINGKPYADHRAPMREVGALLETRAVHGSRSARNHLRALAATTGIGTQRVDEVIAHVGLTEVADMRAGHFSLGMGRRLGIAVALLGDPATIMLDEPVNGLDPEGIRWIRGLLRALAAEGRTILVSSHLMSEMALTADHLVVIGQGRLIRDISVDALIAEAAPTSVRVRTPDADVLRTMLLGPGVTVSSRHPGQLDVVGVSTEEIGRTAALRSIVLYELSESRASLEEAFMKLTRDADGYRTAEVAA